eukprot:4485849-Prymnesium_polylepis.1
MDMVLCQTADGSTRNPHMNGTEPVAHKAGPSASRPVFCLCRALRSVYLAPALQRADSMQALRIMCAYHVHLHCMCPRWAQTQRDR